MKILLLGEYNSSHQTLKQGLEHLGHTVTVVGMGDGFKQRKSDVNFSQKYKAGLPLLINKVLFKLFKIDLHSLSIKRQFYAHKELFQDNEIVQLINEHTFLTQPKIEKELLEYIFKHNKKVFLLSCGLDHISVKFAYDKKYRYGILTPYFQGKKHKKNYYSITKYLSDPFVRLHQYIFEHIQGVIASDLDYHLPLKGHPKYLGMVPNPINIAEFEYQFPEIKDQVVIFHGINRNNYYKKGNYLFEEALELVKKQFSEKIKIVTVESVPYHTYINLFNEAHILLDQVFAYDQGFNALEAMAKGKVVFTGAEQEWLEYFNLEEDTVAINALPDAEKIAEKLIWLIDNPEKLKQISLNARKFIEQHHDHVASAQQYLNYWQSKL